MKWSKLPSSWAITVCICACKYVRWCLSRNPKDWWKVLTQNYPLKPNIKLVTVTVDCTVLRDSLPKPSCTFPHPYIAAFSHVSFSFFSITSFSYSLRAKGKRQIHQTKAHRCKRLSAPPIEPTCSRAVKLCCWAMWRTSEGEGKCRRHYCLFMPLEERREEKQGHWAEQKGNCAVMQTKKY